MTQKIALITGVTGQDGAYLSEYLLKKGYIAFPIKIFTIYHLAKCNLLSVQLRVGL